MEKHSVTATFEFSDEDLIDIFSSAVYSIGYWCRIDNTRNEWNEARAELPKDCTIEDEMLHILKKGQSIQLDDVEGDGVEDYWSLTLENLLKGIKLTIENRHWNGNQYDIDGEIADLIFQYALFDEIVFG